MLSPKTGKTSGHFQQRFVQVDTSNKQKPRSKVEQRPDNPASGLGGEKLWGAKDTKKKKRRVV